MPVKIKFTGEQIKEICNLYENGASSYKLSKIYKVSPNTIVKCLKDNSINIKIRKLEIKPGDKFGRWTVIEEAEKRGLDRYFLCECNCILKTRKEVWAYDLKRGCSQSCGCFNKERVIETNFNSGVDYTGKVFGRLTILSESERDSHEERKVLAQCSCDGNIDIYGLANLKSGGTKSCGCYKKEMLREKTFSVKDYQEKHHLFCKVEEIMDDPDGVGILVRCKHSDCREWFKPTRDQLSGRIAIIEKPGKASQGTELNFYCSEECKHSCDTYRTQIIPKSLRNVKIQSRCNQRINRQALLALQIDECGYNYCEKCGTEFNKSDIALHHNIMVSKDHDMADDMSHQLLLCKKCHKHKGC